MDKQEKWSGKRHTQYLLYEGDEMLLIGKADFQNQKTIITKEPVKDIFMIAPAASVNKWNKYKPLLKAFTITSVVIAIITMFILLADISVYGDVVHVSFKKILFDWNGIF